MNTSSAYELFQDETPVLAIVEKPVVGIGSVISYQWVNECFQLPIIAIHKDFWGRVSKYTVPSIFPEHGVWMQIAATDSLHIVAISEPQEIVGKAWYLVAAWKAGRKVGMYKALAARHADTIFSTTLVSPIKNAKGYGFHDELHTDILPGNPVKHAARMAKARQWQAVYFKLIELYKQAA